MKILVLFAHPAFRKSKVNKMLVDGLSDINGLTFHDLYENYPEFDIDVKKEQELLSEHDVIIFQFPIFWYSTPAILKEWQDLVLEHGWAFGSKGNELKDKLFFCAVSTGAPRNAYQIDGFHSHTLNQLLSPLRQTATLCKMIPLPPYATDGAHAISTNEILDSKNNYLKLLRLMLDDKIDIQKAKQMEYLNDYFKMEDQ